jgi:hypothetical protein
MPTEELINKSFVLTNITNEYTKSQVSLGSLSYFCSNVSEKIPEFDKAPCEEVKQGNHNAFVVLGRDRNANWASGCGGKGMPQSGMIDLVAGRGQLIMANNIKNNKDPMESIAFSGPMFHSDAARIYITQKSLDIDQYFGLEPSKGRTSELKSAVALKADHVRVIGREKVRIFCGAGTFEGFEKGIGETNCLGEKLGNGVIELQVGKQKLHPLVLGDNLVKYLKEKNKTEKKIYEQLFTMNLNLMTLNGICSAIPGAAAALVPFMQKNGTHSIESIVSSLNTYLKDLNYLDNGLIPGADHILSNTVFTT